MQDTKPFKKRHPNWFAVFYLCCYPLYLLFGLGFFLQKWMNKSGESLKQAGKTDSSTKTHVVTAASSVAVDSMDHPEQQPAVANKPEHASDADIKSGTVANTGNNASNSSTGSSVVSKTKKSAVTTPTTAPISLPSSTQSSHVDSSSTVPAAGHQGQMTSPEKADTTGDHVTMTTAAGDQGQMIFSKKVEVTTAVTTPTTAPIGLPGSTQSSHVDTRPSTVSVAGDPSQMTSPKKADTTRDHVTMTTAAGDQGQMASPEKADAIMPANLLPSEVSQKPMSSAPAETITDTVATKVVTLNSSMAPVTPETQAPKASITATTTTLVPVKNSDQAPAIPTVILYRPGLYALGCSKFKDILEEKYSKKINFVEITYNNKENSLEEELSKPQVSGVFLIDTPTSRVAKKSLKIKEFNEKNSGKRVIPFAYLYICDTGGTGTEKSYGENDIMLPYNKDTLPLENKYMNSGAIQFEKALTSFGITGLPGDGSSLLNPPSQQKPSDSTVTNAL